MPSNSMIAEFLGTQPILWGLWAIAFVGVLGLYFLVAALTGKWIKGRLPVRMTPEHVAKLHDRQAVDEVRERRRLHAIVQGRTK